MRYLSSLTLRALSIVTRGAYLSGFQRNRWAKRSRFWTRVLLHADALYHRRKPCDSSCDCVAVYAALISPSPIHRYAAATAGGGRAESAHPDSHQDVPDAAVDKPSALHQRLEHSRGRLVKPISSARSAQNPSIDDRRDSPSWGRSRCQS